MRPRIVVRSASDFGVWAQAQRMPAPAPADPSTGRGAQLFASTNCVNCHAVAGTPAAARVGPDLSHVGSRALLGAGVVENSPAALTRWIRDPQAIKPGVLMPSYANLSNDDLAALAAYLWSLK
jgi:cytochrome c oxidase subunit 2